MIEANFTVSSMHGDMPQKERDAIMKEFRNGQRYDLHLAKKLFLPYEPSIFFIRQKVLITDEFIVRRNHKLHNEVNFYIFESPIAEPIDFIIKYIIEFSFH